jgi:phosphoglycerol transferase MdoB-like AlkP superfamily enzyme
MKSREAPYWAISFIGIARAPYAAKRIVAVTLLLVAAGVIYLRPMGLVFNQWPAAAVTGFLALIILLASYAVNPSLQAALRTVLGVIAGMLILNVARSAWESAWDNVFDLRYLLSLRHDLNIGYCAAAVAAIASLKLWFFPAELRVLGRTLTSRPKALMCFAIAILLVHDGIEMGGGVVRIAYVSLAYVSLLAASLLLTRRPYFSLCVVALISLLVCIVSFAKFRYHGSTFHALDIALYVKLDVFLFLLQHYFRVAGPLLLLMAAASIIMQRIFHTEMRSVSATWPAVGFPVAVGAAFVLSASVLETHHMHFFRNKGHFSSFLVSLATLREEIRIPDASPSSAPKEHCRLTEKPNIFIVLHESTAPFDDVSILPESPSLDAFFRPKESVSGPLRVETWGGATWVTEIGLLSGIPMSILGGQRAHAPLLLAGRFGDTLIKRLAACGYSTIAITSGAVTFANMGPRYTELGFQKVISKVPFDWNAERFRDREYYKIMLDELKAPGGGPVLVYTNTMVTHGPFDFTYAPSELGVKAPPGMNKEVLEYARRISLSAKDYFEFADTLAGMPDYPSLVLRFGDHHPFIAGVVPGGWPFREVEPDKTANKFYTFFSMERPGGHLKVDRDVTTVDAFALLELLRSELGLEAGSRGQLVETCKFDIKRCSGNDKKLDEYLSLLVTDGVMIAR